MTFKVKTKKAKVKSGISRQAFLEKMQKTDYIYDDMDLSEFAQEHFENKKSFEENKRNFFRWVD